MFALTATRCLFRAISRLHLLTLKGSCVRFDRPEGVKLSSSRWDYKRNLCWYSTRKNTRTRRKWFFISSLFSSISLNVRNYLRGLLNKQWEVLCIDVTLQHHLFIRLCIPSILHHYPPYLGTPPSTYIINSIHGTSRFVWVSCVSFLLVQCPRPWQLSNKFVHNFYFLQVMEDCSANNIPQFSSAQEEARYWRQKALEYQRMWVHHYYYCVTCKFLMRSRMSERGHGFFPL